MAHALGPGKQGQSQTGETSEPGNFSDADPQGSGREVAVPAVTRAVGVLRLLSASAVPLGVNQIARELDIIPSTCLHILRALSAEGLVSLDAETKRYRLGLEILNLARPALRDSVADQAQPYLNELANKFSVTAMAVSLSGPEHYIVIAKADSPNAIRLHVDLGSRFPALISATGRCVAAYSNIARKLLKAKFERLRWYDPPSYDEWEKQVNDVVTDGFAIDDCQYLNGVYIIAAPILNKERQFKHAVVTICIKDGWSEEMLKKLAEDARLASAQIAKSLRLTVPIRYSETP